MRRLPGQSCDFCWANLNVHGQETLFDPEMPYCDVTLRPIKEVAADAPAAKSSITRPLRFIYKRDVPHESIVASKIIADLYSAGIQVEPIVLAKDDYNAAMNSWLGSDGEARSADDANSTTTVYCDTSPPVSGAMGCVSFDLAYSEVRVSHDSVEMCHTHSGGFVRASARTFDTRLQVSSLTSTKHSRTHTYTFRRGALRMTQPPNSST